MGRAKQTHAGAIAPAGVMLALATAVVIGSVGCVSGGRVEGASADVLDLIAKQTSRALDEYEGDLQAADARRQEAAVYALSQRVKREGAESVEQHAIALLDALEQISADRLTARQRYEVAMDNVQLLEDVAAGLRRYGERLSQIGEHVKALLGQE